ncbi:MAG: hypothetical protein GY845_02310 [Planctomycetes bacterium]|nr:hypothetical protein [Planctomycetota bacterium]
MVGRPPISDEIWEIVAGIHDENPGWTAIQVEEEVKKRCGGQGPGHSAIGKKLKKLRAQREEEDKDVAETEWSIGASVSHGIPPEESENLIKIWRRCLVLGRCFTIREAQWVARLRGLVDDSYLLYRAKQYAKRERTCKILKYKRIDTRDLDAILAFASGWHGFTWATMTAVMTTHLPLEFPEIKDEAIQSLTYGIPEEVIIMTWPIEEAAEQLMIGEVLHHDSDLIDDLGYVYAAWLKVFSSCKKWQQKLSDEERREIAEKLRAEIVDVKAEIGAYNGPKWWLGVDMSSIEKAFYWLPSTELMEEVGDEFHLNLREKFYER